MESSQPTRSVAIGRYALEVGGSAGTVISAAPVIGDDTAVEIPAELTEPLGKEKGETVGERFERATLAVEEATSRLEWADKLLQSALSGSPFDIDDVLTHAVELLNVLDSLDRQDRWEEWLRYARSIHTLLALAGRWAALVRSLATTLRAAERAAELEAAVGWAEHELGTLHLAVEDATGAKRRLDRAREIRQRLHDAEGLAVTEQSLSVLCRQRARAAETRRGRASRVLAAVAAVLLLLLAGGVAGAVVDPFDDEGEDSGGGGGFAGDVGVPGRVKVTVRTRGEGRVTSRSGRIDCPGQCETSVRRGSQVRLDAAAIGDAVFAGWRRDCKDLDPCVLTVVEPVTVTALFTAKAADQPTLTVNPEGEGGGTVTSDLDDIDCGPSCVAPFGLGRTVVLTQVADDGSEFTGWSGAGCAGIDECSVTLDGSKEVTATFDLEPTTDVTLTTSVREGSGSITATTGSARRGRDCSTPGCAYPLDTAVTLTAKLGEGMNFVSWDGCDTVAGTRCDVTMSATRAVSATFENRIE